MSYGSMGELDEETIRWGVLVSRIVCIVLLIGIIAAVVVGETKDFHQFALNPPAGKHLLTLVDGNCDTGRRGFELLEK